jgi:hypothetical protein
MQAVRRDVESVSARQSSVEGIRDAEDDVLVRAARGDADAVAHLFDAHWPAAWSAAFRLLGVREEADDAAQEAFIKSNGCCLGSRGRARIARG